MFQPARPRGARPIVFDDWFCNYGVSTRAPARGATHTGALNVIVRLFQPARPRGARRRSRLPASPYPSSFNPRAREGRDCRNMQYSAYSNSFYAIIKVH